jgi:hypothetical protein
LKDLPGPIATTIVDHDNFMRNLIHAKFDEMLYRQSDAPLLIARRYHYAQQPELRRFAWT